MDPANYGNNYNQLMLDPANYQFSGDYKYEADADQLMEDGWVDIGADGIIDDYIP